MAGWLYLIGAVFVTINVFTRRFLGFSSAGVVEISGYLLAVGISFGLAETLTTRGHIRVDVLVRSLPLGIRVYMHTIALAFLTGFVVLITVRALDVVATSWRLGSRDTTDLETPLVVPESLWFIGLVLFSVLALLMLARMVALLVTGRHAELDGILGVSQEEEEASALVKELEEMR
jgi:TRAP-type C4-dicarboxylate transport system permease small subunit